MAKVSKDTLKEYFQTGDRPTESEFVNLIDSLTHEDTVEAHITDNNNPHQVTKVQVGLSNVDNTSDANKPISAATQTSINALMAQITGLTTQLEQARAEVTSLATAHIEDKNNPHEVTQAQVGLENVDNTSDADKPISTATQVALVAVTAQIESLATELETARAEVTRLATEHIQDTNNPHQVTQEQIGLGNVDNTNDLDKPISTAMQEALDSKLDKDADAGGGNAYSNGLTQTDGKVTFGGDLVATETSLQFNGARQLNIKDSIGNNVFSVFDAGTSDMEGDPETIGFLMSTAGYIEQRATSGLIDMQALGFVMKAVNPYGFSGYGYDQIINIEALDRGSIQLNTKNLLAPSTELTDIVDKKHLVTKEYVDNQLDSGTSIAENLVPLINKYGESLNSYELKETKVADLVTVDFKQGVVILSKEKASEIITLINRPAEETLTAKFVNPTTGDFGYATVNNNSFGNSELGDNYMFLSGSGVSYSYAESYSYGGGTQIYFVDENGNEILDSKAIPRDGSVALDMYIVSNILDNPSTQKEYNSANAKKWDNLPGAAAGLSLDNNGNIQIGGKVNDIRRIYIEDGQVNWEASNSLTNNTANNTITETLISHVLESDSARMQNFNIANQVTYNLWNKKTNKSAQVVITADGIQMPQETSEAIEAGPSRILVTKEWVNSKLSGGAINTYKKVLEFNNTTNPIEDQQDYTVLNAPPKGTYIKIHSIKFFSDMPNDAGEVGNSYTRFEGQDAFSSEYIDYTGAASTGGLSAEQSNGENLNLTPTDLKSGKALKMFVAAGYGNKEPYTIRYEFEFSIEKN